MAELDIGDVVGDRVLILCDGQHLIGRHIEELGRVIDEPGDQPRTGDAAKPPRWLWSSSSVPPCIRAMRSTIARPSPNPPVSRVRALPRSDEHTSELQSL